jgi:hypothetical protein
MDAHWRLLVGVGATDSTSIAVQFRTGLQRRTPATAAPLSKVPTAQRGATTQLRPSAERIALGMVRQEVTHVPLKRKRPGWHAVQVPTWGTPSRSMHDAQADGHTQRPPSAVKELLQKDNTAGEMRVC